MPTTALAQEAIGIALEIENGTGVPLELQSGRRYYINQLDMRAALTGTVDAGVSSLAFEGDFADLPLDVAGVRLVERLASGAHEPAGLVAEVAAETGRPATEVQVVLDDLLERRLVIDFEVARADRPADPTPTAGAPVDPESSMVLPTPLVVRVGAGGFDAVVLAGRLDTWFSRHFRTHDVALHRLLGAHPH